MLQVNGVPWQAWIEVRPEKVLPSAFKIWPGLLFEAVARAH